MIEVDENTVEDKEGVDEIVEQFDEAKGAKLKYN